MTADALAPHDSVAVCAEANAPVPVRLTTGLPVEAFVENVTVPDDVPAVDAV